MSKLQPFDLHFQTELQQKEPSPNNGPFSQDDNNPLLKRELQEDDHLAFHNHKELSLDAANQSLALLGRSSIEQGIPIPRNMLSHSEDAYQPQEEDEERDADENRIKLEVSEQDKQWFVESLGLNQLLLLRKFPSNTKNVLRNLGNAQNQFILYHETAREQVFQKLANPQKFFDWVRSIRLERFENFKKVWAEEQNPAFRRVYKQLCFKFYKECSIPYVLSSRMKNGETKLSHLRYIYRFLQGLKDPNEFSYFKKVER